MNERRKVVDRRLPDDSFHMTLLDISFNVQHPNIKQFINQKNINFINREFVNFLNKKNVFKYKRSVYDVLGNTKKFLAKKFIIKDNQIVKIK